ncbi:CGNR zinc finger domain-containing protein [Glycomyces sp. TRM65418]|uniref:CGNR zinc finger domain-containing protein n=1 Tax=Glycomyces sp. TRM65418 TaxID=2867006 RepID=UPI001CE4FCCE|nr:CGNR zinc finger domain-containing protein [Glycomyces sp. TRM65418]MCC3763868.1 CGNR zinc finger domain-containing protein [Glycomyces sp. TRM65418]QZD53571.1 CGNR zinc finger domain-containing protein [Glycomyces sp. TRM65418]
MVNTSSDQEAPGALEPVRTLLNTWLIPNDTRQAEDRFEAYADQAGLPRTRRKELRSLRDDLRQAVEHHADTAAIVNDWVERLDIRPRVVDDAIAFTGGGHAADHVAAVLEAIAAGRWHRLKACPDCRWVFYDHSRNASKRWCLMTAGGPGGRSCGGIAKVRAHRERTRATR